MLAYIMVDVCNCMPQCVERADGLFNKFDHFFCAGF